MSVLPVVLVAALASPHAAAPADALLKSLHQRYPEVTRWSIDLLTHEPAGSSGSPHVLQLGARSAVRVGNHVLWYAVAGFQRVVSAIRWIPMGAPLDARAGREAEMDVMAAGCEPLTDVAGLNGSRSRKTLLAHSIICREAIEPRPAVARGDNVTVHYTAQFLSLTTRGVAQEDGAVGDSLNVRNMHNDGVFSAVVSGVDEVTVHD